MRSFTVATAVLAVAATSANAQDADSAANSAGIEEVTVTATRRETNLMETSIAISAFDQDDLDREGIRDIRDAADLVPNFDVAFSPSDSGVQLTIRGINSNNFTEIGDPSVAFHVDGVYSPRPQGAVALMYDLERLEVMRGPQGTLFGRNSAAGSINVITAKPSTDGVFATFGAEMGNRGQQNFLSTVNVPLGENLAIRGNFFIEQRDGYADQGDGRTDLGSQGFQGPDGIPDFDQRWNRPVGEDETYGNADRWAARLSAMWWPTDRLSWRVTAEKAQDNTAGVPIAPNCENNPDLCAFNGGGIDRVDPNIPGFLDMTMDSVRSHVDFALTDSIDLIYNLGWARQQRRQQWDGDMGWRPLPGPNTGWQNRYQPWPSLYLATDRSHFESWSNELQLQGLHGNVNWILGFFDFREDNDIIFDVEQPFCCSLGALGGLSFIQPFRKLNSQAIFGQATWHASDRWHFTAGFRYTADRRIDQGGRGIGCFGGDGCSFSGGAIPNDGFPQDLTSVDELTLPRFTSADLLAGFGSQDRLNNYEVFDINDNLEDFYATDWRLGVDYDFNEDTLIYLYAATGSKAGAFGDGVDVCRCGRIQFFNFEPERVKNFELGYKSRLLDNRLQLTIAAFVTDFTDRQVSQFREVGVVENPPGTPVEPRQPIGTFVTSNASAADIRGLEVEFDWLAWENGRIRGGIGLLDAVISEWNGYPGEAYFCDDRAEAGPQFACIPPDDGEGGSAVEGNRLPYTTPIQASMSIEHDIFLNSGARLTPLVKLSYSGELNFTEGNFDGLPSLSQRRDPFGIVDASVRYVSADETWNAEAFVYNLTDERFPTFWSDWPGAGAPLFAWNPPRVYGFRFAYNVRP
ncbi:MAG: TonB-dependent receptor [Pseudomonadota bacterium]